MRQIASASAGAASLSVTRVVRIVAVMGPRCPRRLHEGNELSECKRFEILSRMDLSPVHVRTFSEVVRQASFSRAAERLHLSQPAVSHHIRHLELALGARLLERAGRRAFPTHAGELLLEHAGRALAELEAARQAIQRLRGVVAGRVRLGTGATASTYLLPDALRRLRAQHPELELVIVTGNSADLAAAVAARAELRARTLTARALAPPLARRLAIVRRRDKPSTPALDAVLAALDGVAGS